jgi:hypothetical protein
VNSVKSEFGRIHVLDRDAFSNGSWFLDRPGCNYARRKRRARMIHFNWRVGDEKVEEMRKHSLWLADSRPAAASGAAADAVSA